MTLIRNSLTRHVSVRRSESIKVFVSRVAAGSEAREQEYRRAFY